MFKKTLTRINKALKSLFINGFLTLLPLVITFTVFSFFFKLIKEWLTPLQELQAHIPYINKIPHAEIGLAIVLVILMGVIFKSIVARSGVELFELIVEKVPVVRPVYQGIKQLIRAFTPDDALAFKQVVLIEFPRQGMYSMGFCTGQLSQKLSPDTSVAFYTIFIPTTPNPTSGFFVIAKEGDFKPTSLTTQEAMSFIISGGIVQPADYKN